MNKHLLVEYSLGLQVPFEKVWVWRVQIPSEEVLGGVGIETTTTTNQCVRPTADRGWGCRTSQCISLRTLHAADVLGGSSHEVILGVRTGGIELG